MKIANRIEYFHSNLPYEIFSINNQKFALFLKEIAIENIDLDWEDYNIVVLAPMCAEANIKIKCQTLIAFANLNAKEGLTMITAGGHIALIGAEILSKKGALLYSPEPTLSRNAFQERSQFIRELFEHGLSQKDDECTADAILATYDAIVDPLLDAKDDEIDGEKAFKFFEIPEISQ